MRKSKCIISTLLIVIILSSICIRTYAESITELQEQSAELTEQLNETNNKLKAVTENISENMAQLQEIDQRISISQEELKAINVKLEELMIQIKENQEKLEKTEKELNDMQDLLDERLIAIYEAPKLQYLDVLMASKSLTEFLSNYYGMKELVEYDTELINIAKQKKLDIETTKKILAEKKKQAIEDTQTQQKKNQVLVNIKTTREYYISKLNKEEQELQAQIDEYNRQVSEMESEIKMLALNSISEDYLGGAMQWPVPGHTGLTSLYGMRVHPITGAYKLHTGIDISAPMRTSFVAAANGIVSKATYNTAYGNMVIIDHGGGVQTLYAHGDEIMVQLGQTVSSGTEVLKVGSTGYSTGPHAHFEIRINGQTVNPLDYLLDNRKQELGEQEQRQDTDTN